MPINRAHNGYLIPDTALTTVESADSGLFRTEFGVCCSPTMIWLATLHCHHINLKMINDCVNKDSMTRHPRITFFTTASLNDGDNIKQIAQSTRSYSHNVDIEENRFSKVGQNYWCL